MPSRAAATQDPAAPGRSAGRRPGTAPSVEETRAPPDERLAFVRGFLIAVVLVLPFWVAVSLTAYVLLF